MKNRIALSSVLVLALFAAIAIPAASATVSLYYLVPDDSGAEGYLNTTTVQLRLNATQEIEGGKVTIVYDPCCANITGFTHGPEWEDWTKASYPGEHIVTFYNEEDGIPVNLSPGDYLIGTYTIQCNSTTPCVTDLIFAMSTPLSPTWATDLWALHVPHVPFTTDNGTFTCIAPQETFSKPLVTGWNLISLPLTNATNMTVANIMSSVSGKYDALYRYDAVNKSWVSMSPSDEMKNGVGYFIHMTSAATWTYTGIPYTEMNISLQPGLNMVGWLNCSKDITDALSSIDGKYWYVARWNATAQEFEVYNPVAPLVFNDFTTMDRGEGYFISMKESAWLNVSC